MLINPNTCTNTRAPEVLALLCLLPGMQNPRAGPNALPGTDLPIMVSGCHQGFRCTMLVSIMSGPISSHLCAEWALSPTSSPSPHPSPPSSTCPSCLPEPAQGPSHALCAPMPLTHAGRWAKAEPGCNLLRSPPPTSTGYACKGTEEGELGATPTVHPAGCMFPSREIPAFLWAAVTSAKRGGGESLWCRGLGAVSPPPRSPPSLLAVSSARTQGM